MPQLGVDARARSHLALVEVHTGGARRHVCPGRVVKDQQDKVILSHLKPWIGRPEVFSCTDHPIGVADVAEQRSSLAGLCHGYSHLKVGARLPCKP